MTEPLKITFRSDHLLAELQHGLSVDTDDGYDEWATIDKRGKSWVATITNRDLALYRLTSALDIAYDNRREGWEDATDRALLRAWPKWVTRIMDHFGWDDLPQYHEGYARDWYRGDKLPARTR